MADPRRGSHSGPLFGPDGRIPAVEAVKAAEVSGVLAFRAGWRLRHTVAMIVLSPLLFLAYQAALGSGLDEVLWLLIVAAMAVLAAAILTSFVPPLGEQQALGSPCTVMTALAVPATGIILHQANGPLSGAIAVAILALSLWQRVGRTSTCG